MSAFLVTGGAGFIGSHIVEKLLESGQYVRVLDNFSSGKITNLKGCTGKIDLIRGDIRSKVTCLKATKDIDFVLHQAALTSVPESMREPREYNKVNIDGTLNILEAAKENKVKRFVFASSCSVYGDAGNLANKESFLPQPLSPYAISKLTAEYYCKIFSLSYNLPAVILRYFNVFGPRQSLNNAYAVVIPKFINCMLRDEPLPVYGTGEQTRDFIFVDNVVQANLLAVKNKALKSGVFNVAYGKGHTVLELVGILNRILGKKTSPIFLKKRPGDIVKSSANLKQAKNVLGYKPGIDFIRGLRLTVDYWRANG